MFVYCIKSSVPNLLYFIPRIGSVLKIHLCLYFRNEQLLGRQTPDPTPLHLEWLMNLKYEANLKIDISIDIRCKHSVQTETFKCNR